MKKKWLRFNTAILLVVIFSIFLSATVMADSAKITLKEHKLSMELPQEYTQISADNAKENKDLIEGFGYSLSSFKTYLEKNNIVLFATNTKDTSQLSFKIWESDFSKNITDLSLLSNEALSTVSSSLITTKGASYKIVTINSMKFFEVRKNDKDSGGDFCTVQYITVRNSKIFSLTFSFHGALDDAKIQNAWDIACTLNIKNTSANIRWDISSITQLILIWGLIITALVAIVFIIISFVKDIIKSKNEADSGTEIIERRSRF